MIVVIVYPDSFSMKVETDARFVSPRKPIEAVFSRLKPVDGMKLTACYVNEEGKHIEVACYKCFDGKLELVSGEES